MAALSSRGKTFIQDAGSTTISLNTDSGIGANSMVLLCGLAQEAGTAPTFTPSGGGLTWAVDVEVTDAGISLAIASALAPAGLSSGTALQFALSESVDNRGIAILSINTDTFEAGDFGSRVYEAGVAQWEGPSINFPESDGFVVTHAVQTALDASPPAADHTPYPDYTEIYWTEMFSPLIASWFVMDTLMFASDPAHVPGGAWSPDAQIAYNLNVAVAYHIPFFDPGSAGGPVTPARPRGFGPF